MYFKISKGNIEEVISYRGPKREREEDWEARSRPPVGYSRWQRPWRPQRSWQAGSDAKGPEGAASARERTRFSEKWYIFQ